MTERKTPLQVVIAGKSARISVREWRTPKPQGTVICLHGLGVTGAEYAPMAESLNQAGFDVLSPDWIGHGDSDYLDDPGAYEWASYIKCFTTVLRHYRSPSMHFVGASWGGALLFLFLLSQKLLPQSSSFVDVPLRSTARLTKPRHVFEEQIQGKFASIAEAKAFLAQQRPEFANVPEKFSAYFDKERYYTKANGEVTFRFDPAILPAFSVHAASKFDYVASLRRIYFNALFLYGTASPYSLPAEFKAACAQVPQIHYRDDMPGGHPPTLLHEDQFMLVVDFIKRAKFLRDLDKLK